MTRSESCFFPFFATFPCALFSFPCLSFLLCRHSSFSVRNGMRPTLLLFDWKAAAREESFLEERRKDGAVSITACALNRCFCQTTALGSPSNTRALAKSGAQSMPACLAVSRTPPALLLRKNLQLPVLLSAVSRVDVLSLSFNGPHCSVQGKQYDLGPKSVCIAVSSFDHVKKRLGTFAQKSNFALVASAARVCFRGWKCRAGQRVTVLGLFRHRVSLGSARSPRGARSASSAFIVLSPSSATRHTPSGA